MGYLHASAVLLAATVATLPASGFAQTDSAAVFRQAIDARNRGDIVAMMAYFTDDAVREDASCPQQCVGREAVRKAFQKNIDDHFHANLTFVEGSGETVTARAEVSSDVFRAQGIEKRTTSYTIRLKDGKIAWWSSPLPQTPPKAN